jgi:hypothetical protein
MIRSRHVFALNQTLEGRQTSLLLVSGREPPGQGRVVTAHRSPPPKPSTLWSDRSPIVKTFRPGSCNHGHHLPLKPPSSESRAMDAGDAGDPRGSAEASGTSCKSGSRSLARGGAWSGPKKSPNSAPCVPTNAGTTSGKRNVPDHHFQLHPVPACSSMASLLGLESKD